MINWSKFKTHLYFHIIFYHSSGSACVDSIESLIFLFTMRMGLDCWKRKLNDSVLDEQGFQIFDILYLFSERKDMHISISRFIAGPKTFLLKFWSFTLWFIAIGEEWKSLALWSKKNFLTQLLIKFEKKFISENVELFCCLCAVS